MKKISRCDVNKFVIRDFAKSADSSTTLSALESDNAKFLEKLDSRLKAIESNLALLSKSPKEGGMQDILQEAHAKSFQNEPSEQAKILESSAEILDYKHNLLNSLIKLEESVQKVNAHFIGLKENLHMFALDIAKKVIKYELHTNSQQIALSACRKLLESVDKTFSIQIYLNPQDYLFVKKHLKAQENLEILCDEVVATGGVLIKNEFLNLAFDVEQEFAQAIKDLQDLSHKDKANNKDKKEMSDE